MYLRETLYLISLFHVNEIRAMTVEVSVKRIKKSKYL